VDSIAFRNHQGLSAANSDIGIYLGIAGSLVFTMSATKQHAPAISDVLGGSMAVASGRISYLLGLTGPCISMDTACSASLVALHVASKSVSIGDCRLGCACGESLIDEVVSAGLTSAGMLSELGRCHTFDH
jgi:acyl transferase domain-containing protein